MKKALIVGLGIAVAVMVSGVAQAGEGKGPHKGRGAEWFATADTNKDGKLSLDEFKAACKGGDAEAKFQQADTDKDGFLTPEELKAAKMHKRGKDKCPNAPAAPAAPAVAPAAK